MTDPKIRVESLTVRYGKLTALKGVSINIFQDQITALIGPSGCGKTTFLRALNRMLDLIDNARVEGKIFLDGVDIYSPEVDVSELRRRMGMVFQKPNPLPFSIFDNVAYGPRLQGIKKKSKLREIVERALRDAALWEEVKDRLHEPAWNLSGGQQQRLCIARALAVGPEVMLFDEPCSSLDPASTLRIEELLRQLKGKLAIVIVTHNMQQAARVSDWTGFFLNGELVEFGETGRVFESPSDPRTEAYVTGRFG